MREIETNRRRVLKTIGGGVGAGAGLGVSSVPVVGSPSLDEVEIVTVRSGKEVKETKTVSRKWWSHVQRARQVREQLGEIYEHNDEVKSLGRAPTKDNRIHDRMTTHVRVYVDDIDSVDTSIPNEVNGIDVRVFQHKEGDLDGCNKTEDDPLPGGITGSNNQCLDGGTWCCRLKDSDTGEKYMLHCGHVFSICDEPDIDAYNRCHYVGDMVQSSASRDAAIFKETWETVLENGYSDWIRNENHGPIMGHVTKNGIEDLAAKGYDGESVYKMGVSTCKTEGFIEEIEISQSLGCAPDNDEYLAIGNNREGGDSGGPYYQQKWDPYSKEPYLAMVGTHSRHYAWGGSVGIASYEISNWSGLSFG